MVRILIVDDSRLILAHLKTELEALGNFEILKAHDGQEALDVLAHQPGIGLIFLDLKMPVLDGFGFLEAFRGGDHAAVPVVVISSETDESLQRALALGARSAIKKPVDRNDLQGVVEKYAQPMA